LWESCFWRSSARTEIQRVLSCACAEALHEKFLENFAAALADPAKEKVEVVRDVPKELTPINSMPLKAKQVSFDVYHKIWTQVATTKPISRCKFKLSILSLFSSRLFCLG